jgi:hypothetical protein
MHPLVTPIEGANPRKMLLFWFFCGVAAKKHHSMVATCNRTSTSYDENRLRPLVIIAV